MRRRIHVCHMRRRIHVCHMRRRIHTLLLLGTFLYQVAHLEQAQKAAASVSAASSPPQTQKAEEQEQEEEEKEELKGQVIALRQKLQAHEQQVQEAQKLIEKHQKLPAATKAIACCSQGPCHIPSTQDHGCAEGEAHQVAHLEQAQKAAAASPPPSGSAAFSPPKTQKAEEKKKEEKEEELKGQVNALRQKLQAHEQQVQEAQKLSQNNQKWPAVTSAFRVEGSAGKTDAAHEKKMDEKEWHEKKMLLEARLMAQIHRLLIGSVSTTHSAGVALSKRV
jgi:hypothetical protein